MIKTLQRWLAARKEKREAKAFVQKFVAHNLDALNFEPRTLPHNEGMQVFRPQVPPEPNPTSWIGANPSLNSDQEWPTLEGVPAIFLAQISLGDLPANVWGGLGPADGSLAFFWHPPEYRSIVVLHVVGPSEKSEYPEDAPLEHIIGYDLNKHYSIGFGEGVTPRPLFWPLERIDAIVQEEGDRRLNSVVHKLKLLEPQISPYDADRAQILVRAASEQYKKQLERFADANQSVEQSDIQKERRNRVLASIGEFQRLSSDLASDENLDEIIQNVDDIVSGKVQGIDGKGAQFKERYWESPYKYAVELVSRVKYLSDRASLPEAVSASFEQVWRDQANLETITVGGDVSKGFTYTVTKEPVLLLKLLPSALANCSVGGGQVIGAFISPDDLKNRRWDRVWGDFVN